MDKCFYKCFYQVYIVLFEFQIQLFGIPSTCLSLASHLFYFSNNKNFPERKSKQQQQHQQQQNSHRVSLINQVIPVSNR